MTRDRLASLRVQDVFKLGSQMGLGMSDVEVDVLRVEIADRLFE